MKSFLWILFVLLYPVSILANVLPTLPIPLLSLEKDQSKGEKDCQPNPESGPYFSALNKTSHEIVELFSSNQLLSESDFVKFVIKQYDIQAGHDLSDKDIVLRLHPQDWNYYFELQREIARLIPEESKRPTIDLTLTTTKKDEVPSSIGIAGGTGPLSDSELLKVLMGQLLKDKKINWDQFAINLFSSPPPRTLREKFGHGVTYFERMTAFATRGHNKYFLASNTAHAHIGMVRELVSFTKYRQGEREKESVVVDLVDHVVREVLQGDHSAEILVLGTLQAYQDALYPSYLVKYGAKSGREAEKPEEGKHPKEKGRYYTVSTPERAKELQSYIDLAKQGNVEEAGKKMKKFILEEMESIEKLQKPSKSKIPFKVILGCTEIPMAVQGKVLEELRADLSKKNQIDAQLYNSEELFSQKILQSVEKITHH